MKKYVVTTLLFICLALFSGTASKVPASVFSPSVIQNVLDHSLAVVVYFEVPESSADKTVQRLAAMGITSHRVDPKDPAAVGIAQGSVAVAVIGAATLVQNDYALTVAHLVEVKSEIGGLLKIIRLWVLQKDVDHPIAARVVAQTNPATGEFTDDYCVLQLAEKLGLPGIRIAKNPASQGDPVMFFGTVDGAAFFGRFGFVTSFHRFFRRGEDRQIHLSQWTDVPFTCVYPGGGGDSGGGIFSVAGELIGIMYCGCVIAQEQYIFANPLQMLKEFLQKNDFKALLK